MAITPQSVTKNDIQKGLEANLPPLPLAGDIYVTTDTDKLCICFENGIWTNQEIPVSNPLSVDENGVLFFNGNIIVAQPEAEIPETLNGNAEYVGNDTTITFDVSAFPVPCELKFSTKSSHNWSGRADLFINGELADSGNASTQTSTWTSKIFVFRSKPNQVQIKLVRGSTIVTYHDNKISGKTLSALKVTE